MKRLDILQKLEERLKSISVANGYFTNIGSNVCYQKITPFEYLSTGGINFGDKVQSVKEINNKHEHSLFVEIEAVVFEDLALFYSNQVLADLIEAIGLDQTFDRTCLSTTIDPEQSIFVSVDVQGAKAVKVAVNLVILYRTELWKND